MIVAPLVSDSEFEQTQLVDRGESMSDERRRRRREQRSGAQRSSTLRSRLGDPRLDVVRAGDHVVIEQHEMGHLVVVRPPTETSPDAMLGRRLVHGPERTRSSDVGDLTTSQSS